MIKRWLLEFVFGGCGGATFIADIGLLILRVWTGAAMLIGHGWEKLPFATGNRYQNVMDGIEADFPFPFLSGWIAILGETLAAGLLALGLCTRVAALWLAGVMLAAAFVYHSGDPYFGMEGGSKEKALLYAIPAICFLLAGSGKTGIDQFLRRK